MTSAVYYSTGPESLHHLITFYLITFPFNQGLDENEKYRIRVEEGEAFLMMGVSCYTRVLRPDYFNFIMSPMCQE